MTPRSVLIVGGGLAGITAALDCARAGVEVTLLERRGRLGGAAYSFPRDGLSVDNGQHVFLRCCTDYRALLDDLDAGDLVTMQPRLSVPVLSPDGRTGWLRRTGLPAPLHLAGSLLRYPFLSPMERVSVAVTMQMLGRIDLDDPANDERSFGAWLRAHRQHRAAVDSIWDLILRPTVNLAVEDASLAQAAQVFQVGLLEGAGNADIGWASVPLSEIHDRRGQAALRRAGVAIRMRCGARSVTAVGGGFHVSASDGFEADVDAVILAVPPARAEGLLPPAAGVAAGFAERLGTSPIVNLHVVYDRRVLEHEFVAGVGSPVEWVFDRTRSSGVDEGQYLAVSLSAADADLNATAEELRSRYLPALGELLPAARDATVNSFFVTREHAATFRAGPGARRWRVPARTELPGLAIAGAWTDTGWPATMEGAVRSGHAAARAVLVTGTRGAGSDTSRGGWMRTATGVESPLFLAALSIEAKAIRSGAPWAEVRQTGMGPRRAAQAAESGVVDGSRPIVIGGFCGGLDPALEPGDVVLADEVRGPDGTTRCDDSAIIAGVLRRAGLRVHVGPIVSSERIVHGEERRVLNATGAVAVDMESAWLAPAVRTRPFVVLRVVSDTEGGLRRPLHTIAGFRAAYRALRQASSLLDQVPGNERRGDRTIAPETMHVKLPPEVNRRSR